ncbi:MAG TPA: nucleotidyltransferase [Anaerolineaceae bacterium]|jgi:glucose-1-phosphate thymidylyltransferase|nr:nucleotidyltransferase [Anaerolineaceae bacterium]
MSKDLQILIPMGGFGKRLRPLTWSRPKPLVCLAGKTVIDYVLEMFNSIPDFESAELVFSINEAIEVLIREHVAKYYPDRKVTFAIDRAMRGQSDAFWQAREVLKGPLLVVFSDTIIENDFSFLKDETADGVIWVKPVPDPRRFGVTLCDEEGWITELIEKPSEMTHNLAVVGCYYFKDAEILLSAIGEQIERKLYLKGEFYLADAINILLNRGLKMRTEKVATWLDAGTPEALLATNRYLLERNLSHNKDLTNLVNTVIIPPVSIHPTAKIENAVIGPHVSLGEGTEIANSLIKDSIIGPRSHINHSRLEMSLVGYDVTITGQTGRFNLGDNAQAIQ